MTDLTKLEAELAAAVTAAADVAALEAVRVAALGKSGSISELLKTLGSMTPDERRERGPAINGLRDHIGAAIAERKAALEAAELDARLAAERVDLTLPAPPERRGRVHPTMQVLDEMIAIFAEMGFGLAEGPDIEDDFHNFTALNFPPKHPAREMHDTFWLQEDERGERKVLRTHTSPVQVRVMQRLNEKLPGWIANGQEPPIRVIVPGRTYRSDSDATHSPMFHQMEGLVIGKDIHMGHLKWTVDTFIQRFFETPSVETRFRPHHFPFTEPWA
jgi:phenylalanyl-tRNA synthetase alpha chain